MSCKTGAVEEGGELIGGARVGRKKAHEYD
jgi:hypothetical protein